MTDEQQPKKFRWTVILGVFFIFFSFGGFIAGDALPAILLVILGLALFPFVQTYIERKFNIQLTKTLKRTFFWLVFIVFGWTMVSSDTSQKQAQTKEVPEAAVQEQEAPAPEISTAPKPNLYRVLGVVDGDTIRVQIDGIDEVIRLIGINTPETVDPRTPVQCFGQEASAKAKEVLSDTSVSLESDATQADKDKYNRPLRYVFLEDGTNFNKLMIEEGYAYEYTYAVPYKYQEDFKNAEKAAKDAKRGLWAPDTCNGSLKNNHSEPNDKNMSEPAGAAKPKSSSSAFTCEGKRVCGSMKSCEEAKFYLNSCGVSSLDRDKDGVPCEDLCN